VLAYVTEEWDTFDTWCLSRGVDTGTLSARRLVNLTVAHLTDGLDPERVRVFLDDAERIGRQFFEPPAEPPIPDAAPPPGWRSDEENWRHIQATLGQMSTIGKAVNRA
jgi:hypothetical protein